MCSRLFLNYHNKLFIYSQIFLHFLAISKDCVLIHNIFHRVWGPVNCGELEIHQDTHEGGTRSIVLNQVSRHELGPFLQWGFYLFAFLFIETDSHVGQAGLQLVMNHGQPWTLPWSSCLWLLPRIAGRYLHAQEELCPLHSSETVCKCIWRPCRSPRVEAGSEAVSDSLSTSCPHHQELYCDLCHLCVTRPAFLTGLFWLKEDTFSVVCGKPF